LGPEFSTRTFSIVTPDPGALGVFLQVAASVREHFLIALQHMFRAVSRADAVGEALQEKGEVASAGNVNFAQICDSGADSDAGESGIEVEGEGEDEDAAPEMGANEGGGGGADAEVPREGSAGCFGKGCWYIGGLL